MNFISNFFSHFVEPDVRTALLVVLNLIVIESLLSVDNAAVLATMVMHLPDRQRKRALRIGIFYAYLFRGGSLILVSFLMKLAWLKLIGGAYLLYLFADFFYGKFTAENNDEVNAAGPHAKPTRKLPGLSIFWSTVVMVEIMDLIFSIDNVFAAVAFTKNIYLICTGVFIGIITMRIVAGYFVKLMERFPFLDTIAFLVIGILGMRLCLDFFCTYFSDNTVCQLLHAEHTDLYFSLLTVSIFFVPILSSLFFGFPKGKKH